MKTLTVKIPEEMDAKLSALATQKGQSKSEVIRTAIEQVVEFGDQIKDVSALGQIADLVGCVKGAKGLSHNKDYMKGYGRQVISTIMPRD